MPASGIASSTVTVQPLETTLPVFALTWATPVASVSMRIRSPELGSGSTCTTPCGCAIQSTVPVTSEVDPSSKVAIAVTPETFPTCRSSDFGVTCSETILRMWMPPSEEPASGEAPSSVPASRAGFSPPPGGSVSGAFPQAEAARTQSAAETRTRRNIEALPGERTRHDPRPHPGRQREPSGRETAS